jgi:hypothetical protein
MFGSCLNYVTLRLLGQACENDALTKGRAWILSHGGASAIPQWGKIWLSVWHHISTRILSFICLYLPVYMEIRP